MRDWALWSKFDNNDGVWRKDGHVRSNSPLNYWQAGEIEREKHSIMPANKADKMSIVFTPAYILGRMKIC